MKNTDRYGLVPGLMSTGSQLLYRNMSNFAKGRLYYYAFFQPDKDAMEQLSHMLDTNQLEPVIENVFKFNDLPQGYEEAGKSGRGKTVLDFSDLHE